MILISVIPLGSVFAVLIFDDDDDDKNDENYRNERIMIMIYFG